MKLTDTQTITEITEFIKASALPRKDLIALFYGLICLSFKRDKDSNKMQGISRKWSLAFMNAATWLIYNLVYRPKVYKDCKGRKCIEDLMQNLAPATLKLQAMLGTGKPRAWDNGGLYYQVYKALIQGWQHLDRSANSIDLDNQIAITANDSKFTINFMDALIDVYAIGDPGLRKQQLSSHYLGWRSALLEDWYINPNMYPTLLTIDSNQAVLKHEGHELRLRFTNLTGVEYQELKVMIQPITDDNWVTWESKDAELVETAFVDNKCIMDVDQIMNKYWLGFVVLTEDGSVPEAWEVGSLQEWQLWPEQAQADLANESED